jgi:flagellar biosynthetic protein FliO
VDWAPNASQNRSLRIIFGILQRPALRETSVMRYRKKIVVFLITVVLGSGVLLVCSARSATDGTELEDSKSKSNSLFGNDPNFSTITGDKPGIRELFFKMMFSVLFLVVLGVAAIYVSKRFGAKITKLPGKKIRIAETVHLGPRKAVHLLEVGERRFLIGSTNESITRLADLTSPAAASAFAETSALTELSVQEMDNN